MVYLDLSTDLYQFVYYYLMNRKRELKEFIFPDNDNFTMIILNDNESPKVDCNAICIIEVI